MIIWVGIILNRVVVETLNRRFSKLCGSHLQKKKHFLWLLTVGSITSRRSGDEPALGSKTGPGRRWKSSLTLSRRLLNNMLFALIVRV